VVKAGGAREAEMAKLLENTYGTSTSRW